MKDKLGKAVSQASGHDPDRHVHYQRQVLCVRSFCLVEVEAVGVGDGEGVEGLFPALGVGDDFTSSVGAHAADREVEDFEHGVVGREVSFGGSSYLRVFVGLATRPWMCVVL